MKELTIEDLEQMLERAEMAASVTLPADKFKELVLLAAKGLGYEIKEE